MGTAVELEKTRTLVTALDTENLAVKDRLQTEKHTTEILTELSNTRKSESEALRAELTAKNETIAAKDAVIASQDKLIVALKTKKSSPWRRLGDVLIGAAIFAILK
jgi:chromosome segregation ATPase